MSEPNICLFPCEAHRDCTASFTVAVPSFANMPRTVCPHCEPDWQEKYAAPQASQPPQGAEPQLVGDAVIKALFLKHFGSAEEGDWLSAGGSMFTEGFNVGRRYRALAAPPQGASSLLPELHDALRDLQASATWKVRPSQQLIDRIVNGCRALAASPLPAPQEPAALRIVAKPLNWEQMSETEWSDDRGFFIRFDPEDDPDGPYSVAWGEGDAENFKTLDEAKAWCVRKIEGWINECAYAAPAPVDPESQGSGQ